MPKTVCLQFVRELTCSSRFCPRARRPLKALWFCSVGRVEQKSGYSLNLIRQWKSLRSMHGTGNECEARLCGQKNTGLGKNLPWSKSTVLLKLLMYLCSACCPLLVCVNSCKRHALIPLSCPNISITPPHSCVFHCVWDIPPLLRELQGDYLLFSVSSPFKSNQNEQAGDTAVRTRKVANCLVSARLHVCACVCVGSMKDSRDQSDPSHLAMWLTLISSISDACSGSSK